MSALTPEERETLACVATGHEPDICDCNDTYDDERFCWSAQETFRVVARIVAAREAAARAEVVAALKSKWRGLPVWGPDEHGLHILDGVDHEGLMADLDAVLATPRGAEATVNGFVARLMRQQRADGFQEERTSKERQEGINRMAALTRRIESNEATEPRP